MPTANYKIQAMWQPRIEDPEQIAVRLRRLISMLQTVHPLTRKWYHVNFEGACYDIDTLGDRLVNTIVGRVSKGDFGEPEPEWGYHLIAYNRPDVAKPPQGLWLDGRVGGYVSSSLSIATNYDLAPDPRIISYDVFKAMLFALDEAFEPDWVSAGPSDLTEFIDMRHYPRTPMLLAWMINLSPPIAQLIQPPPGVISERGDDGSLFMAGTYETFVTGNPKHMAAAQAVNDVVDPLNYVVPFETIIVPKPTSKPPEPVDPTP